MMCLACVSREKKKVVVAIRGTQSIADLVTDAVVHPEPMDSWVPQVPTPSTPSLPSPGDPSATP